MRALPAIHWRGAPVPQPVLVFVVVHVVAIAAISTAAAWVGANVPVTPVEPWMLARTDASARWVQAQAVPPVGFAPPPNVAGSPAQDWPVWLRPSVEHDRARPWIEAPGGRVVMRR